MLVSAATAGVVAGLALGFMLYALVFDQIGLGWIIGGYVFFVAALAAVYFGFIVLSSRGYSLANLGKGFNAELRTGQILDYGIAADGCAVAHGVMSIPKTVGDIDHLVVTPARLCVVETKHQKVPKGIYRKVLTRIADNVKAVRCWAFPGTIVEGYLVLQHDEDVSLPQRPDANGEKITVCTAPWLRKKIRPDIYGPQTVDKRLVRKVWELGHWNLDD